MSDRWMSKACRQKPRAHFVVDGAAICNTSGWVCRFVDEVNIDPRCPECARLVSQALGRAAVPFDLTPKEARLLAKLLEQDRISIGNITPAVNRLRKRGLVWLDCARVMTLTGNGITVAGELYSAGSA